MSSTIETNLYTYKGLSANVRVINNKPSGTSFFEYYKDTASLQYSVFLVLKIIKDIPIEGSIKKERKYYDISLSTFDMRNIKKFFKHFDDLFEKDYYSEVEDPDKGLIKRLKTEYKDDIKKNFTNVTNKKQISCRMGFLINKDDQSYTDAISVFINENESKVTIEKDRFLALVDLVMGLDLHSIARELITTYNTNLILRRKAIQENSKNITVN